MTTARTVGTIAVVDRATRALATQMCVYVPCTVARDALGRGPDFEDSEIISWGNLTIDEARLVIAVDLDADLRDDVLAQLGRLQEAAVDRDVFWSLYFGTN